MAADVELRTLEAAGLALAYRRAGEGPPLVLLHGALGDSRSWRPQLEGLATHFDVIAWDAPGCGASSDPLRPFGFDEWADALAALLDALGIDAAHVLGLSWGSTLAQVFWERHRARLRSLVLAGVYAGWKGSLSADELERRVEAMEGRLAQPERLVAEFVPTLVGPDAPPAIPADLAAVAREMHPHGTLLMLEAMAAADTRPLLARIDVPALVICGEHDVRSPVETGHELAAAIGDARVAVIPGSGHMTNLERPQAFNEAVREFCLAAEPR